MKMLTDIKKGRRHSVNPLTIKNLELLPKINENNKKKRKSFYSNRSEKNNDMKMPSNYLDEEEVEITQRDRKENEKNKEKEKYVITEETQKYLDKKIIHLINCYKDLKFRENTLKKMKTKKLHLVNSLNINESKTANVNNNILSKSLTKTYRISELEEKEGIKKLDEWDNNNLAQLYGNSDLIFNSLLNHYEKLGDYQKILELKYYKNIIESNGDEVGKMVNIQSINNKIIKDFLNSKVKEQKYILQNSIAKTQTRFHKTSLFTKEKKLAISLGIDNETLAEIKKYEERGKNNYDKVIKEKDKKEVIKKEELVSILIKIFNKKIEKKMKEQQQSEIFEEVNHIYSKYNAKIMKIQDEIDMSRELYNRIKETEYDKNDKEKMMEKTTQLYQIKFEVNTKMANQLKLKKELNKQMEELSKSKEKINGELDICKNELSYMKLVYINLVKNQRNYYLDVLKKGYDVRDEGLIWVVKRLLEIQTKLEYHHFPKFLDHNQIKYIIEVANLSLEETQLKIILKIVEKKRNGIQNSVNNQVMNKIAELSKAKNRHRMSVFTLEMEKIRNQLVGQDSSTRIFETFQKIYRKYKNNFSNKNFQKDEDLKIQNIIEELRVSLIEGGGTTTNDNFQQLTGILDYLNSNKESKEYLEILLLVKFRLSYINKLKDNLREEQINNFKELASSNHNNRFFNAELSLRLDLIKAALFGNKV